MNGSRNFILGLMRMNRLSMELHPTGQSGCFGTLKAEVRAFGGQRRLAIESGVSRRTVSRLMRGQKNSKGCRGQNSAGPERSVRRSPTVFAAAR